MMNKLIEVGEPLCLDALKFLRSEDIDLIECISFQLRNMVEKGRKHILPRHRLNELEFFYSDRDSINYSETRKISALYKRDCDCKIAKNTVEHRHSTCRLLPSMVTTCKRWVDAPCFETCQSSFSVIKLEYISSAIFFIGLI